MNYFEMELHVIAIREYYKPLAVIFSKIPTEAKQREAS